MLVGVRVDESTHHRLALASRRRSSPQRLPSTTVGGTAGKAANTLTVWLMTDAQQNPSWEKIVNAANAAFEKDHAGWNVNVQYKTWGNHLQQFDATLAGGNAPDVIELGNTEMTKYMAAGAFQDLTSVKSSIPNSSTWLAGLAASGKYGGKVYGVPYYAGARVVTYRTDLFKQAGIKKLPTSLAEFTAAAKKLDAKNKTKGFSPVYIAGTDWYTALGFVYDYGGKIATQTSGKWKGTLDSPRAIAGLTAYKNFFAAASHASKTTDEAHPFPYDVYAKGLVGAMPGASLGHVLHRQVQGRLGPVRDAEPHEGSGDAELPRRLQPWRAGRRQQGGRGGLDQRVHRATRR